MGDRPGRGFAGMVFRGDEFLGSNELFCGQRPSRRTSLFETRHRRASSATRQSGFSPADSTTWIRRLFGPRPILPLVLMNAVFESISKILKDSEAGLLSRLLRLTFETATAYFRDCYVLLSSLLRLFARPDGQRNSAKKCGVVQMGDRPGRGFAGTESWGYS
jgi:hypothetical protein